MSCCSLGVNAFRPSVQVATHCLSRLSRPIVPVRFLSSSTTTTTTCYSQSTQNRRRPGRGTTTTYALLQKPSPWPTAAQRLGIRTVFGGRITYKYYIDLPPNYTDEDGLDFSTKDLTVEEIVAIFGTDIDVYNANKLLKIIHGRRIAGTLEDPALARRSYGYTVEHRKAALAYLRKYYPVDEIANAGLRAEDELAALDALEEETMSENAEESTANEITEEPVEKKNRLYKDVTQEKKSVYGESVMDHLRAHREKKNREAEKKRQEEEDAKRAEEEKNGVAGPLTPLTHPEKFARLSPTVQKWISSATSDLKEPPKLTAWQRLWPSAAFVLVLLGGLGVYVYTYKPKKRSERWFPEIPPAAATVGAIMLLNALVYLAWKSPMLWAPFNKYMLIAPAVPKPVALLGAMFSHQAFGHLFVNMSVLGVVGTLLHDDIGRAKFLSLYLGSGLIAALASMAVAVAGQRWHITTLGASGAVYGAIGAYFWMHRLDGHQIFGFPPEGIKGIVFLAFVTATNISFLLSRAARRRIDVTSHFAGLGVGVGAGQWFLEEKKRKGVEKARMRPMAVRVSKV
ncbi:hypothetical protein QBC40DRAFT_222742 [Triangularia verruculosa]|uniref:Peptidase S54 rhomboid domain-containing protein n=1 Tax=Triangularia verruculosa TaxID=2587418 RepID=A0AAN6XJ99_9PEZI|nr:hypothetical protein QBC40DRAFT_222742 [Triangularia verruculosa]